MTQTEKQNETGAYDWLEPRGQTPCCCFDMIMF